MTCRNCGCFVDDNGITKTSDGISACVFCSAPCHNCNKVYLNDKLTRNVKTGHHRCSDCTNK